MPDTPSGTNVPGRVHQHKGEIQGVMVVQGMPVLPPAAPAVLSVEVHSLDNLFFNPLPFSLSFIHNLSLPPTVESLSFNWREIASRTFYAAVWP